MQIKWNYLSRVRVGQDRPTSQGKDPPSVKQPDVLLKVHIQMLGAVEVKMGIVVPGVL